MADFKLKLHRGEGMVLIAMNWCTGTPPDNFVGFAIEYALPGSATFIEIKNRLAFNDPPVAAGTAVAQQFPTKASPIQKFRWVHFPRNADLPGNFNYRVTPVFMDANGALSYGEARLEDVVLASETYPGKLNVAFTRGFVSSQAFVDRYAVHGPISTLVPDDANKGLGFKPTHPDAAKALPWMGFEARAAILEVLDAAIKDKTAEVRVVAYDFNLPELLVRLEQLGSRLKIIIDNSDDHGATGSAENAAAKRFVASAGAANVKRQHMGNLQHNKTIVATGKVNKAVCGSTNLSWRGLYVQANNAIIVQGEKPVKLFVDAFKNYWKQTGFAKSPSASLTSLGLEGIDAEIAFSPHSGGKKGNALLQKIADDVSATESSLLYSLAFLYQTTGGILDAIQKVSNDDDIFVYGISDKKVGGLVLQKPDGGKAPVFPAALDEDVPEPFNKESTGGGGNRMHHKFLVIDFDKPTARVYMGSYNFSNPADKSNGENLLVIRDRRIAVSYMIEALRIFDHYHFRVARAEAKKKKERLELAKPPRQPGEEAWWKKDYTIPRRIKDRELFA